jgi:hypothetical protein
MAERRKRILKKIEKWEKWLLSLSPEERAFWDSIPEFFIL